MAKNRLRILKNNMELDEYLKAIENCPDEYLKERKKRPLWRLTAEFGIYDNWPILLSADYNEVIKDLIESPNLEELFSGQYLIKKEYHGENGQINKVFDYLPGTVKIQAINQISDFGCIPIRYSPEHFKRQKQEFNIALMLHPYQDKKIENINDIRAIAIVVGDLCRYACKKQIALCLPCSRGWDYLEDASRIVYFTPKKIN